MADHRQYTLAMLDFKCAADEDEQWTARKAMAKIERTAAELYGFNFADSLRNEEGK